MIFYQKYLNSINQCSVLTKIMTEKIGTKVVIKLVISYFFMKITCKDSKKIIFRAAFRYNSSLYHKFL